MGKDKTTSIANLRNDLMVMDSLAMTQIMGGRHLDIRSGINSCGGILPS